MGNEIVERIFNTMEKEKITQQQLANELEIGQSTVASWKKRDCPPPLIYINKISTILGVSIEYLINGSNKQIYINSSDLTTEEQYLIDVYRRVDDRGKRSILTTVQREDQEAGPPASGTGFANIGS